MKKRLSEYFRMIKWSDEVCFRFKEISVLWNWRKIIGNNESEWLNSAFCWIAEELAGFTSFWVGLDRSTKWLTPVSWPLCGCTSFRTILKRLVYRGWNLMWTMKKEKLQRGKVQRLQKQRIASVALKIFGTSKTECIFFPKATLIWFDPGQMATAMSTSAVLSPHFIFIMHLEWPSKKKWYWPPKTTVLPSDKTLKIFTYTKSFSVFVRSKRLFFARKYITGQQKWPSK